MTQTLRLPTVYIVSFGDDYERFNIGVATSLSDAKGIVDQYLAFVAEGPAGPYDWAAVEMVPTGHVGDTDMLNLDRALEMELNAND